MRVFLIYMIGSANFHPAKFTVSRQNEGAPSGWLRHLHELRHAAYHHHDYVIVSRVFLGFIMTLR